MKILLLICLIYLTSSITWPYSIVQQDHSLTPYELTFTQMPTVGSTLTINLSARVQSTFLHINEFMCAKIYYRQINDQRPYTRNFNNPRILNMLRNDIYNIRTEINLQDPYFNYYGKYVFRIQVGTYVPNPNPNVNQCYYHLEFEFKVDLTNNSGNLQKDE